MRVRQSITVRDLTGSMKISDEVTRHTDLDDSSVQPAKYTARLMALPGPAVD